MKLVPLGEICTVINGGTPDTKISEYWNGEHSWITPAEMGNLPSPYLGSSRRMLTGEGLRNSSAQLLPRHSVILSSRAPIGHLVINQVPMASNQGCKGLIPSKDLNYKYLYYFLFANKEFLNSLGSGTTFAEISGSKLKTVLIPVPSLGIQLVIVEKLDRAFEEIDALETNLGLGEDKYRQLLQSVLSAAFTPMSISQHRKNLPAKEEQIENWQNVTLKEICDVDWGNTKLTKSSYVVDGSFLAVSASGADGLIDHYEHEANVPVLSAIGAQCGRMFFPGAPFTAIKNTITLTPKEHVSEGKFLYYLFTHVELPQRGAGQPFISKGDIEAFQVTIPSSQDKQREIVAILDLAFDLVDTLSSQSKAGHQLASELRNSILIEAFSTKDGAA